MGGARRAKGGERKINTLRKCEEGIKREKNMCRKGNEDKKRVGRGKAGVIRVKRDGTMKWKKEVCEGRKVQKDQ